MGNYIKREGEKKEKGRGGEREKRRKTKE